MAGRSALGSCCDSGFTTKVPYSSTISCMLLQMNSLKESSCCRTRPFSSKKAEMTAQASSCNARADEGDRSLAVVSSFMATAWEEIGCHGTSRPAACLAICLLLQSRKMVDS